MTKRLLTLALAAMLAFSLVVTASAAETIDFYANGMLKDFFDSDGDDDAAEGFLKNAGRGELDWKDGMLWYVDRPHSYSGLDILFAGVPDGSYTLVAEVKSSQAMAHGFSINANATGWGTVLSAGVGATSATLKLDLEIADGTASVTNTRGTANVRFVRLQNRGSVEEGDDNVEEDQPDFAIVSLKLVAAGDDGGNGSANGGNGSANGGGTAAPDGNKPVDTGIADVAVASAIALVAVGAVVFSRKRK